jgi:hypothetical protein
MAPGVYSAMLAEQDGLCAICHRPETAVRHGKAMLLAVDHDHTTGAVRGLLCHNCNTKVAAYEWAMSADPLVVQISEYIDRSAGK